MSAWSEPPEGHFENFRTWMCLSDFKIWTFFITIFAPIYTIPSVGASPDSDSTLVDSDSDSDSTSVDSDSSAGDSDSGLMDSDSDSDSTQVDTDSQ